MSESESTSRVIYLLQTSMQELVVERDKLKEVCQPIYERIWNMPVKADGTSDYSQMGLPNELVEICKAMKKYNR